MYNPNNPEKSFDVYIDKNPRDTIPIKYTKTKNTQTYMASRYDYVRLKVLKQLKPQQYTLAHNYFLFLGKRTKLNEEDRYKFSFNNKIV